MVPGRADVALRLTAFFATGLLITVFFLLECRFADVFATVRFLDDRRFEADFLAMAFFFANFLLLAGFFDDDFFRETAFFVLDFLTDTFFFLTLLILAAVFFLDDGLPFAAVFFLEDGLPFAVFFVAVFFLEDGLPLATFFREAFVGLRFLLAGFFAGIIFSYRSEKNAQLYIACGYMEARISSFSCTIPYRGSPCCQGRLIWPG